MNFKINGVLVFMFASIRKETKFINKTCLETVFDQFYYFTLLYHTNQQNNIMQSIKYQMYSRKKMQNSNTLLHLLNYTHNVTDALTVLQSGWLRGDF